MIGIVNKFFKKNIESSYCLIFKKNGFIKSEKELNITLCTLKQDE